MRRETGPISISISISVGIGRVVRLCVKGIAK